MMTRIKSRAQWLARAALTLALCLAAGAAVAPANADNPPAPPSSDFFYGYVFINGSMAPAGTTVVAKIGATTYATVQTAVIQGYDPNPVYQLSVPPYDPVTQTGGQNGNTVLFFINGTQAIQSGTFALFGNTNLDLSMNNSNPGSLSVTTASATGVGTTTATLNGNLTGMGGNSSVAVSFNYGTTTGYGSTIAAGSLSATGPFSASIGSLLASTTYHYIAVAQGSGSPVTGTDMTFTTGAVPAMSVNTLAATNVTSTSATLNGSLVSLGANPVVNVYFRYGLDTSYGSSTATQPLSAAGAFSANLNNLTPGATYHYVAVGQNSTTALGTDMTFTAGSASVTTGGATNITGTSATLGGTLNGLGLASFATVYFQYGPTTSYGYTTDSTSMSAIGAFSLNVSGLTNNSAYNYRAVVVAGSSIAYGANATFTTIGGGGVPPNQFYGNVYINGSLAPAGATVTAYINGTQSATTTTDSLGRYGWTSPFVVYNGPGIVTFTVNGIQTSQSAQWTVGGVTNVDLVPTPLGVITNTALTGDSSATLNGAVTGLGSDTYATVSFQWGLTTSYGNTAAGSPSTISGTGSFTAALTSLTNAVQYHCRAVATGSPSGTTVYGGDVAFTPNSSGSNQLIGPADSTATGRTSRNAFILDRFSATGTGNINVIRVKCWNSGNVKVAIYADNTGSPGSLLAAVNTGTAVTPGWNSIPITSTAVTAGTYYWLAFIMDYESVSYQQSGATTRWYSWLDYSSFTFPASVDPSGFVTGTTIWYDYITGWTS
ncbi:MAG: beta strand repeat-containing protein [Dehalococcoidia bacterium]